MFTFFNTHLEKKLVAIYVYIFNWKLLFIIHIFDHFMTV